MPKTIVEVDVADLATIGDFLDRLPMEPHEVDAYVNATLAPILRRIAGKELPHRVFGDDL